MRNVGIYVFDEVEVLDFAGPFEVFSTASRVCCRAQPGAEPPFQVFTVGASQRPVTARGGLVVQPRCSFADHPKIDVLLVPGGVVTAELERPRVIAWVAARSATAELTASVCTGAFLLARARLLKGKSATTHWEDIADLRAMAPSHARGTGRALGRGRRRHHVGGHLGRAGHEPAHRGAPCRTRPRRAHGAADGLRVAGRGAWRVRRRGLNRGVVPKGGDDGKVISFSSGGQSAPFGRCSYSVSSHVSPTRSRPKLRCGSEWIRRNPAFS